MKGHHRNADNLLLRLFSYTPREGRTALEDFCTEALAWCLRNSSKVRKSILNLTKLDGLQDCGDHVLVHTQHSFETEEPPENDAPHGPELGRFDMMIQSENPTFLLVCETKLCSTPEPRQLQLYRRELDNDARFGFYPRTKRFLVSLTASAKKPDGVDAHLAWGHIQAELAGVARSDVAEANEAFAQAVCLQFSEFLKEKGLALMNIGKINQETIKSLLGAMKIREELEIFLKSLATSVQVLRGRKPRYDYNPDQKVGYLCLTPGKPEVLDTVAFAFKEFGQGVQLAMHVSKMFEGNRRSLEQTLDKRLKGCLVYKEDLYIPGSNQSWFNFEQPVTAEYDGNAEKMREWFVQTCEAVVKLGTTRKG